MNWNRFKFKPLGEGWTMYCLGLFMGILTATDYDWARATSTALAVYVVISILNWIVHGGE